MPISDIDISEVPKQRRKSRLDNMPEIIALRERMEKPLTDKTAIKLEVSPETIKIYGSHKKFTESLRQKVRLQYQSLSLSVANQVIYLTLKKKYRSKDHPKPKEGK